MKIIVIEDNEADYFLINRALKDDNELTHVRTLKEFSEYYHSDFFDFDLIVSDINLTDSVGFSTMEAFFPIKEVPILFMTGQEDVELVYQCVLWGFQHFIFKSEMKPIKLRLKVKSIFDSLKAHDSELVWRFTDYGFIEKLIEMKQNPPQERVRFVYLNIINFDEIILKHGYSLSQYFLHHVMDTLQSLDPMKVYEMGGGAKILAVYQSKVELEYISRIVQSIQSNLSTKALFDVGVVFRTKILQIQKDSDFPKSLVKDLMF